MFRTLVKQTGKQMSKQLLSAAAENYRKRNPQLQALDALDD